jgi:photoactive yellow protein
MWHWAPFRLMHPEDFSPAIAAEGAVTGRDPGTVIGKDFFRDVTPFTSTSECKGFFNAGINTDNSNTMF